MTYEVIDWRNLRMDGDEQHCNMVMALVNGYRLYDPDTSAVIKARVAHMPTQCGGRYINIHCESRTMDVSYMHEAPHTVYGDGRTWFPCGANGLLAITAELPYYMMQELRDQMLVYREKLHDHSGKYCEMAHPDCPITPAPADKDWQRRAWVIALADILAHDGESYDDEGECEECGRTVFACDDGYCEDCDWHTYVGDRETPDEDHNIGLSGEPDSDYVNYEPDSYELDFDDSVECRWHATLWEAGDRTAGASTLMTLVNAEIVSFNSVETMTEGDVEYLPMAKFIEKYVLPVCLWQGPVFLSSNVAEPEYATPYLIAALRRSASLLRNYGLRLVAPDHFATNPNERNHYIDGIMIVGVDASEMSNMHRRSLTQNNW